MPPIVVNDRAYRIRTSQRAGRWAAHAVLIENGDRYGGNFHAESEAAAVEAVTRWLEWQNEHAAALDTLLDAERAYHRSVTGHLFANAGNEEDARRARRERLEEVERATVRLDEVRARCPDAL